jgi:hypothetical protein
MLQQWLQPVLGGVLGFFLLKVYHFFSLLISSHSTLKEGGHATVQFSFLLGRREGWFQQPVAGPWKEKDVECLGAGQGYSYPSFRSFLVWFLIQFSPKIGQSNTNFYWVLQCCWFKNRQQKMCHHRFRNQQWWWSHFWFYFFLLGVL